MSGVEDVSEALIRRKLRRAIRELEIFRPGAVSHIEPPAEPGGLYMATVNGRPMPYVDPTLAVGDVVKYVDQPDPFAWARLDGLTEIIDGGGKAGADLPAVLINYADLFGFLRVTSSTVFGGTYTPPFGETRGAFLLGGASSQASHTASTSSRDVVYDDSAVGAGTASLAYKWIEPGDSYNDPWTVTYPSLQGDFCILRSWEILGVSGVYEVSDTVDTAAEFPTVFAPGPDWLVLYVAVAEGFGGLGGSGADPIPGTSIDFDPAITDVTTGYSPRPNISADGDFVIGYELTDAYGDTTPRSFDLPGFAGSYLMTTFLLDTREPE